MTITKGMIEPENYRMTGREFKERRERLGMTQGELAGRLGVNEDSIGKWERGVRPMLNPWMVNISLSYIEQLVCGIPPEPMLDVRGINDFIG